MRNHERRPHLLRAARSGEEGRRLLCGPTSQTCAAAIACEKAACGADQASSSHRRSARSISLSALAGSAPAHPAILCFGIAMTLSTIASDSSFRPLVLSAGTGMRNRDASSRWLVIGHAKHSGVTALHLHPEVSAKPYQPASCSFLETSSDLQCASSTSDCRSIACR